MPPMKITETPANPPANGNPGTVPPWLANPIRILPMPDGWEAPVPSDEFHILPIDLKVPAS